MQIFLFVYILLFVFFSWIAMLVAEGFPKVGGHASPFHDFFFEFSASKPMALHEVPPTLKNKAPNLKIPTHPMHAHTHTGK